MVDWEFLNLEPTTDLKAIKRAYAKKLKIHHPEDDPEGYQKLRETFDQAKQYARENKSGNKAQAISGGSHDTGSVYDESLHAAEINNTDNGFSEEANQADIEYDYVEYSSFSAWTNANESTDNSLVEIDAFMEQLEQLYANYSARIDLYNWEKLMEADIVWDMGAHDVLTFRLLDFLESHHQFPKEIWWMLDNQFNIKEKFPVFFDTYILDFPDLHYHSLIETEHIDRDSFLYYRSKFHQCLASDQLDEAETVMKKAEEIYTDDPDFLRLQAEYYRRAGKINDCLKALHTYTELRPEDADILLQKAQLMLEVHQTQEALHACQAAKEIQPDNLQILRLEGQCLYQMGAFTQAREKFQRVLMKRKLDIISQTYLARVDAELGKANLKHDKRRKIQQEMGIMGLKEKVSLYWGILPKIRLILAFILIFIVTAELNEDYKENTGVGFFDFFKQKMISPEFVQIETRSDLPREHNDDILVSATLHDAFFTGYYKTEAEDEQGYINDNFQQADADIIEMLHELDAELVWAGYLNDGTPVLSLLPYSESRELMQTQDIEVRGNWQFIPQEELGYELGNSYDINSYKSMEEFNQDSLINGMQTVNTTDMDTFKLVVNTVIYISIYLALLYYIVTRIIRRLLLFRY